MKPFIRVGPDDPVAGNIFPIHKLRNPGNKKTKSCQHDIPHLFFYIRYKIVFSPLNLI